MGGYAGGRSGRRATVEGTAALVLDAEAVARPAKEALRRKGLSAVPWGQCLDWPPRLWKWSRDGEPWAQVEVTLRLGAGSGTARLRYDVEHLTRPTGRQDQQVGLEATSCRFGGVRWWWRCPAAGRRCAKLYLPNGGRLFLGRSAYHLAYASQSEDRIGRAHRRAGHLHRRLGSEERLACAPAPPKPKWMRWRTYDRLVAELRDNEDDFLAGAMRVLGHR